MAEKSKKKPKRIASADDLIDDVIGNVRVHFQEAGVGEDVLQKLQQLWRSKLGLDEKPQAAPNVEKNSEVAKDAKVDMASASTSSKAAGSGVENVTLEHVIGAQEPKSGASSAQGPPAEASGNMDGDGAQGPLGEASGYGDEDGAQGPLGGASGNMDEGGAQGPLGGDSGYGDEDGAHGLLGGTSGNGNKDGAQRHLGGASLFMDGDGAQDSGNEGLDAADFVSDLPGEEADQPLERKISDGELLNSDDDLTDDDDDDGSFETDNVIYCRYNRISHRRRKWKFHLNSGVMFVGGQTYVFNTATGDAEF